jgi:Tfp pilus assembly protein PilN
VNQQVNLYRGVLRPQPTPLSARTIAVLLLVTVVVLGGIYGWMTWRLDQRQAELAALEAEQEKVASRMQDLSQRVGEQQVDPELEERAASLEAELRAKRQLTSLLGGKTAGNVDGFSALLVPLARRHVEGLWLREIALREGGKQLALRGQTLDAARVPDYLEALREESAYEGRRFATFRMQRMPEERGLGFVIATRCPGVGDDERVERAAACLDGDD